MSVHQINGHWYIRFTIDGERYRKAVKEAQTKRQAERAEQIIRNEIFEKRFGESGQRNFADFVEKTYKPNARQHKKGFEVERSVLKALIESFGKLRLGEITPQHVQQFQLQRATEITNRKTTRSKATVNRDVAVLSAILKLAVRLGELKENAASKIQYYGNLHKRDRVLTDEEEIQLLHSADQQLRRKIEIHLYTGLRRSELFLLEWRDIDFENGRIRIRPETTKTGTARMVRMFSNVREILVDLCSEAGNVLPDSLIFEGGTGAVHVFSRQLKAACESVGIANLSAHTLRHSFSTRANRFGVDPFAQKAALGHAKLSQTADYTHQSNETFSNNWDGFEAHLRQRKDKNGKLQ